MKKKWKIAFGLIIATALAGLVWPTKDSNPEYFETLDQLVFSDIAWLLTASCLVLLMTPGLSLFYGGMVGKKNMEKSCHKFSS